MPAERFEAGQSALGQTSAPAPDHQVGDQVSHADQDDQVAEGDDLIGEGERNRVAEPAHHGVVVGDLARSRQHDPIDLVGLDHAGFDEGIGANRGGPVQGDRDEVGDDADADDRHADQHEVANDEGEGGDEAGEGPPTGAGQIEAVDRDTDRDGDHEQRQRGDAGSGDGAEVSLPGSPDDESDDDGQNQGRESHRRNPPGRARRPPTSVRVEARFAADPWLSAPVGRDQSPEPRAVPSRSSPSLRKT